MIIHYKKRMINVEAKRLSPLGKITGLMFKTRNTKNLLFEFKKDTRIRIHSVFVLFDFLAIWLDEKNKVIDYRTVSPFTLSVQPKKEFRKLVEIPLNKKNTKIVKFFVGEERFK